MPFLDLVYTFKLGNLHLFCSYAGLLECGSISQVPLHATCFLTKFVNYTELIVETTNTDIDNLFLSNTMTYNHDLPASSTSFASLILAAINGDPPRSGWLSNIIFL